MRLSTESLRTRWLVLLAAWALAAGLLFLHASIVRDYLALVTNMGARPEGRAATPLQAAYPGFAIDAQTWVRHALSLLEGDDVRLRFTTIDNAPFGREVHWNSAWGWVLAGAGWLQHTLTDEPLPRAMERVTVWLAPAAFVALILIMSGWVSRRAGVIAGAFVALAMVGHPRVAEGFFPTYVDHHGLLTVAAMGAILGAVFMGAGWWGDRVASPVLHPGSVQQVREGAVFSAVSGAFGMWVSAASSIPPLAIIGAAAVAAIVLVGRRAMAAGLQFDGGAWRLWGRVGGCISLVFYLVEYFPNHLGLRLESNHPLYGIAWVAGGELIAQFGERWLGAPAMRWRAPGTLALAVVGVLLAPLVIWIGGPKVFVVSDPFLAQLHHLYIQEFLPLMTTIRGTGWATFFSVVGAENLPLLVGAGVVLIRWRSCPLALVFAVIGTLLCTAMAWVQARWMLNASGSQIALALLLVAYFSSERKFAARIGIAVAGVLLPFWPTLYSRYKGAHDDIVHRRVSPKDACSALFRDIAATLRASSPNEEIILLTQPNASTTVGYYGRFKTLGTLYWENVAGLKAAATIFSARSEDEAARLVRERKITHIAIISEENFIEQYNRLLDPAITTAELKRSFGYQLLVDRSIPPWLQMLPYRIPADLTTLKWDVLLFKVAFDQSPADALYHLALAKIAGGAVADGERDLDTLIEKSPESPQPWLRKAELRFAAQDWSTAAALMINGIRRAPPAERPQVFANAASSFYRAERPAEAVQIYRAALSDRYDPHLAAYLAFLLVTTKDPKVHDAAEGLKLAEKARVTAPDSPTVLNAWAAALAENGRFDEAVAAAERALALARQKGDKAAERVSEQRVATFRSQKTLRD